MNMKPNDGLNDRLKLLWEELPLIPGQLGP